VSPIVVVAAPPFAFPLLRGRSSGFWILAEYPAFCCCSHFWLSHRCRLMRHGTHTAPSACGYIESRPKQRRVVRWSHLVLATRPPSPAPPHLAVAELRPLYACILNSIECIPSTRCDAMLLCLKLPPCTPFFRSTRRIRNVAIPSRGESKRYVSVAHSLGVGIWEYRNRRSYQRFQVIIKMQHILQTCHYVYGVRVCVPCVCGVWCAYIHIWVSFYSPKPPLTLRMVCAFSLATFHRFFPSLLVSSGATYSFFFVILHVVYTTDLVLFFFHFYSAFSVFLFCCFCSDFYYFSMLKTRRRIKLVFLLLQDPFFQGPTSAVRYRVSISR